MNLESLQKKLLAAAKANPPADRVPWAFEQRVRAQLSAKPVMDLAAWWSRALWRATVPCLALTLVMIGLEIFSASAGKTTTPTGNLVTMAATEDLPTAFEQTLLASAEPSASLDFLEDN